MPSLKVAQRLLLGFVLITVLVAGLAWLTLYLSGWQERQIEEVRVAAVATADHAVGMATAARAIHAEVQGLMAQPSSTPAPGNGAEAAARAAQHGTRRAVEDGFTTFDRHLARSRELGMQDLRAAERVREIEGPYTAYKQAVSQLLELRLASELGADVGPSMAFFENQIRPTFEEMLLPPLTRHVSATQATVAQRIEEAQGTRRLAGVFGLVGALLLLLVVAVTGYVLTRDIGKRLTQSVNAARAIAAGQLTNPIRVGSDDEFGDLAEALNDMVARLSTATVSKTYVENIVQSMADPLVVVDPDVRIAMVNQAVLDLLGYEADELVGASVTRIFAHTGRNRGSAIKQDIERGLAGNVDSKFRTKAGQEVLVSLSSALVRASGEVQGLVIVAKDITEQKRREQELIVAKEEAEKMVQLRDAFLANMSHEIRTPLTGILGSAQVLAEVVEGEHRNLAKIIEDAGNRLLDTINSVLEMARIEAGEVQPEMEILDFVEEAEMVSNVLRPVAEKKGLALRVVPPARGRVHAQLDRTCLNRILNNLVGNAIKFTKEGGVSIEIDTEGDFALLTVRDTGIGITKEFLPFLFDDFKQESTGLRRSHEGSGLGLAITKKLVDMMGGTIEVDSVKGLGSSFIVRFPRVPVEEAAALTPEAFVEGDGFAPVESAAINAGSGEPLPAGQRPDRDILLIEDNQQNAFMARFMLEGFTTDIANSPEEALDLVRRFQYGVLLVDINLGTEFSGIDLLHEFRKIEGVDATPAVAVTAYALPGDRERFLGEGFDDYVSKPYRKETLREAVERALALPAEQAPAHNLEVVLGGSFEEPAEASPEPKAAAPRAAAPTPAAPPPPAEPVAPLSDRAALDAFPLASPDEFLPPSFQPPRGAFTPEAAEVVQKAEQRPERRSEPPRPAAPPTPPLLDADDDFYFVDFQPSDSSGDGPGGPSGPSGR